MGDQSCINLFMMKQGLVIHFEGFFLKKITIITPQDGPLTTNIEPKMNSTAVWKHISDYQF